MGGTRTYETNLGRRYTNRENMGPRIALLLMGVFLVLAGVAFVVLEISTVFAALLPAVFMVVLYVGIRRTFGNLADEVLLGSDGLLVRSGKARERVPFKRVSSVRYEKRNTSGVMIGTLPVIHLTLRDGSGQVKEVAFVPKSRKGEVRAATADATFQSLVDDLLRRAEEAR